MIVKDEESFIAQCIECVSSIVNEIIIVDTGSTDGTVAIAENYGATVLYRPWDNDFSAPRNLSLQHAKSDWILVLDADEMIDVRDLAKIQQLTLHPEYAYSLTQRHYTNDPRLSGFTLCHGEYEYWEKKYSGYFESSLCRLFPNNKGIHYQGLVHELVEHSIFKIPDVTLTSAHLTIHHYGHTPEVKEKKNKGVLYTPLGAQKLIQQPTDWKGWYELGVEHNNNGNRIESAEALTKAAELNPGYVTTWVNLGYVQCELGKYKEAIKSLYTALAIDADCYEAFCNLGVIFMRCKEYPRAEIALRQAINLCPEYVNAMNNLGKTLAFQNKFAEALAMFNQVIRLAPTQYSALSDTCTILLAMKNYPEALKRLKVLETALPTNPRVLYMIAEALKGVGKARDAILYLGKVCEVLEQVGQNGECLQEIERVRSVISALNTNL